VEQEFPGWQTEPVVWKTTSVGRETTWDAEQTTEVAGTAEKEVVGNSPTEVAGLPWKVGSEPGKVAGQTVKVGEAPEKVAALPEEVGAATERGKAMLWKGLN